MDWRGTLSSSHPSFGVSVFFLSFLDWRTNKKKKACENESRTPDKLASPP